ncbi:aminoglycoside N-acetyltransferase AAC(6')-Ii [soil metagenome]
MTFVLADFKMLAAAPQAEAAGILRAALAQLPSGYRAPGEAEAEVEGRCADEDWLGYGAFDGERLVGWIGALRSYRHGWEIHPLVVAPDRQRRGVGSVLLAALEDRALRAGVQTLFLGSDDDYGGTSLFGRDLWPDEAVDKAGKSAVEVARQAGTVEATARGHAITFYRRHGYQIVGLLPDVNGKGQPDILMAKHLDGPMPSRSSA